MLQLRKRDDAHPLHAYLSNTHLPSPIPPAAARVLTITDRFGTRVRQLRLEHKLTQVQLAHHLGMDRSFLSDVERGKKAISLSYLETLAQGFGLSLAQLLADL